LKEVKEISKFIKTSKPALNNKGKRKSYTQVSQLAINTREVLKIKETFLNLQVKKIENIQKIINGEGKPKPKINITIKSSSRKQVIVPINNDNKIKFMEDSCNHITNINRTLKVSSQK